MVAPRTALVFWSVFFPRNAAALSIHRHRIKAATGARESRNDLSFFGSSSFVGVVRRANKDGGVRGIVSALEGGQLGNGNNNNNNNAGRSCKAGMVADTTHHETSSRDHRSEVEVEVEVDTNGGEDSNGSNPVQNDKHSYQDDSRTLYHVPPLRACRDYNTDFRDYDLEALADALHTDGVVVLPNVYSEDQIEVFREAHEENLRTIQNLISETEAVQKPYRHDFDRKRYYVMPHYEIRDEKTGQWHEIIEISPGRLDYTFGMNGDDDDDDDEEKSSGGEIANVFGSVEFQRPKILADLMDKMLRADYRSYAGALPSAGKSREGPWHRDILLLFDDETVDINLPHPYYFTVLIPLVTVGEENGATEFLLGSHRTTCAEALEKTTPSFKACAEPGSIVVFDGRICHRGGRNRTDGDRAVLYMVWTKMWYDD